MKPENKKLLLRLLLNTVLLIAIYFIAAYLQFPYIHYIYISAGIGLGFYYVIYNRGFSGKGVTPEMLPSAMSQEEKLAFIEDSKARMQKSRWVLTLLIPIIVTVAIDMTYLFILPLFGVGV